MMEKRDKKRQEHRYIYILFYVNSFTSLWSVNRKSHSYVLYTSVCVIWSFVNIKQKLNLLFEDLCIFRVYHSNGALLNI